LKDSSKSKVIILLTDGVNNAGFIEPETAADIAKQYGIKVYTIGIGTNGMADEGQRKRTKTPTTFLSRN
jgi:Ca-activated chloride channel family protein